MDKNNEKKLIEALESRQYSVTKTPSRGLLIEKTLPLSLGTFVYDEKYYWRQSTPNWVLFVILLFVFGLGIAYIVLFYLYVSQMSHEVRRLRDSFGGK